MENGPAKQSGIGVVGIPFCKGQPRGGTELGPDALRESGLIAQLEHFGNKVTDYGNLSLSIVEDDKPVNGVKYPRTVGQANKQVAESVANITGSGQTALTLGGDHSVAIGSILGHQRSRPDLVVIWVDAHADLNTALSTTSGNMHGMPLSFVLKEMASYSAPLPGFEWATPSVSTKDLVYIGLRDVDEAEVVYIRELGIKCYSMHEVEKYGVPTVMERVLSSIDPSGKRPIHLSFDVDAMDPEVAPSTGTPVTGGLTKREMFYIAEEIKNTGRLSCLDVVEVNPALGTEADRQKTVRSAVEVVTHFFGKKRRGFIPPDYKLPGAEK